MKSAVASILFVPAICLAQQSPSEQTVVFQSGVNMVIVPVAVRDAKGHAVGNLGIEDFRLFDNGKIQTISRFAVEKNVGSSEFAPSAQAVPGQIVPALTEAPAAGVVAEASSEGLPNRFVAYFFDDLHMDISQLHDTRAAALRSIEKIGPLDRVAIYTSSGAHMQDFTSDRGKLRNALAALGIGQAGATAAQRGASCPPMTYYMAEAIYIRGESEATDVATAEALGCSGLSDAKLIAAMVNDSAREHYYLGDRESEWALDALRTVVGKTASMPGQRNIVLASPGFMVPSDRRDEESALIERALRSNIVIGSLDTRGLYTMIPGGDASTKGTAALSPKIIGELHSFKTKESMEQGEILETLASGTGGVLYKGLNDMDEGLSRTAATSEYVYLLAFSPSAMKPDGSYHQLTVKLANLKGMDLQVRKGYYAPRFLEDQEMQAKREEQSAFFSDTEVHDLPAVLQTQYFKASSGEATLSAIVKIDVRKLSFRKEDERNRDNLTVLTGLFDDGGNFVAGFEKLVTLRLLDDTLSRAGSGLSVKSGFHVHSGRYMVRMVVHDSEGRLMASQSSLVQIP